MFKQLMATVAGATVATLAMASPAGAAAPEKYQFSVQGKGAEAVWSNCETAVAEGDTCEETWVIASQYVSDGFAGAEVFYQRVSLRLVEMPGKGLILEPVSGEWGFGPADTLQIDRRLSSASVSGTVEVFDGSCDPYFDETCTGTPMSISAQWTATGAAQRFVSGSNQHGTGGTTNTIQRWVGRDAVASSTVTDGPSTWAGIFDSTYREFSILRW